MPITTGIDVGSGAVKVVVMDCGSADASQVLSKSSSRIRRRDIAKVVEEVYAAAVEGAGSPEIDYVATTGDGEEVPFATGHFYGMTTHARGALFLDPRARAVLDVGALHARAVAMDERGRVLGYKMTSQCASGSGQFLENISRYLGVSQEEIGPLSLEGDQPEKVSSICAVLAETDVINMVSRGIATANILGGVHESMADRYGRLLKSLPDAAVIFVSGGLASDVGLRAALQRALEKKRPADAAPFELSTHEDAIFAGAIGAALWGAFRHAKLVSTAASTSSESAVGAH